MRAIKRLFSSNVYLPPRQLVQQYNSTIRLQSNAQLPTQYNTLMTEILIKCETPSQFLKQLLNYFKKLSNHQSILKLLTIIHYFIIQVKYNKQDIKDVQQFDMHVLLENKKYQQKWLLQFYQCYCAYLMKLPSLADVYSQALYKQHNIQPTFHLTHIFRLTNTVRVLFPSMTNAVNIIGRYQATKYTAMKELFVILSGELVKVYSYIKYLCDQILRQYRVYNTKDLQCFILTLPELELLCDKIQDLLVNKYLKGKKITSKIQFKQQKVAEVQYYLNYQFNGKADKIMNEKTNVQ